MALNEDQRLDLVVAVLATYSYSLENAWALRKKLKEVGLVDPKNVVGKDEGEVGNLMKKAGYDRGGITYIIAPRLISLMEAVKAGELDLLAKQIASKNEKAFLECLSKVKGFGPKSCAVAWELMKGSKK
ncbi:MAG: hypothetical protein P1U82_23580 [Verrucomicrobiales bacterium]|nr:hypothetical protein [Verrucomicrobiales bacterium]